MNWGSYAERLAAASECCGTCYGGVLGEAQRGEDRYSTAGPNQNLPLLDAVVLPALRSEVGRPRRDRRASKRQRRARRDGRR